MIDDYQDIEKECKEIEKSSEIQIKNIKNIFDKINAFHSCIKSLKNNINAIPILSNNPFVFLDSSLKNFTNLLDKNQLVIEKWILKPLNNLMNNIKFTFNDNLKRLNEIKIDLSGEKTKLNIKKNEFFNFQTQNDKKNNKKKNKLEKDEIIFEDAIKENYGQLYKYELDKMNEIIDENNKKYNDLHHELNTIYTNSILVVKEALTQFSNIVRNIGEIMNMLSLEISNKMESSFDNKEILQALDDEKQNNERRFKKEIIRRFSQEENDYNKNYKINNNFVILENLYNEEENIEEQKYIDDIIEKLIASEEELKSKEISNLLNVLKTKNKKSDTNYSKIFLIKILQACKNNLLYVKNKENFIHLSNIINNICLNDKDETYTFYRIIDISQRVLYKKIFLYKIIRKKNKYFSIKSLWVKISWISLIEKLNKYIKELKEKIKHKEEKDKKEKKEKNKNKDTEKKEDRNKEKEKDNLKIFLKKKDLYSNIKDYGKLIKTKSQIKEVNIFSKEIVFKILLNLIPSMLFFNVDNNIIFDIIEEYSKYFDLKEDETEHLKNKVFINNLMNNQKNEKESKIIIALSFAGKFLQFNDFQKIIILNKNIYKKINQKVFLYFNVKMDINKTLEFWNRWLKIDEIKINYKYKDIKNGINISIYQGQITKERKELKNMEVIEQDLKRTEYIQKNPTYFNAFKSILNCFLITFPFIGYCQGMNCLVSFLYQLLEEDEEKTFFFLCGLQLNTIYHEIFEDEFETLSIFFKVFDYILFIMKPHIYYKFKYNSVLPNCYVSSWFITLFTEFISVIKKENPPLLIIFIFNKFITGNWTSIFNFGYMLIELFDQKITQINNENLIYYIMNIFEEENIFDDENFEKCKNIFLKNENIINDDFINKLIDISKYEHYHN